MSLLEHASFIIHYLGWQTERDFGGTCSKAGPARQSAITSVCAVTGEDLGPYEILPQIGAPDDTRIEVLVVTLVSVKAKTSIYVTFLLNFLRTSCGGAYAEANNLGGWRRRRNFPQSPLSWVNGIASIYGVGRRGSWPRRFIPKHAHRAYQIVEGVE